MMSELRKYLDLATDALLREFLYSESSYEAIWKNYDERMKECIYECSPLGNKIDGPQGIYWIGKDPKIFFIAQQSYGWNGKHVLQPEVIKLMPVQFTYNTFPSLSGYFGKIRYIANKVFSRNNSLPANDLLKYIALSNVCKCYIPDNNIQRFLFQNCRKRKYFQHEIQVVNAPIVVLFTRKYHMLLSLDSKLDYSKTIIELKHAGKYYFELDHPGRVSNEVVNQLINKLHVTLREIGFTTAAENVA